MNLREKYRKLLTDWADYALSDVYACPDRPDLMYYGDGTNGWGVQTNQKAFAAFAALAAEQGGEKYLPYAIATLRYSLASHIAGDYHTTDADDFKWGHTWISSLGIERMMHGVEAIFDHLTERDREMLRAMLTSESDWLLDNYPVKAGLVNDNKPESNMWNGAVMIRCAAMYPDTPRAAEYIERGKEFLANAISLECDEFCDDIVDGKPVREYFVGANFFDSCATNHHGYMNVGYMVITMSNLAMLHFSLRRMGVTPPTLLYRNFEKSFRLIRACIFDDGRLNRIGGDTRIRYCYCQDYLIPVLLLAADCGIADAREMESLESNWAEIIEKEVKHNGDGSFLSDRCELFVEKSPLYYTRLESDRAVSLSYGLVWRSFFGDFDGTTSIPYTPDAECRKPLTEWHDDYHGSMYVRGENRFASFTWMASEMPVALCTPPSDSSLAEWRYNMSGEILGDGFSNSHKSAKYNYRIYDKAFATCGRFLSHTAGLIAEQIYEEDTAVCRMAFAALPDDATTVTLQYASAPKRIHIHRLRAFKLNVPSDIFNDFKRDYVYDDDGRFLSVDGKLGVQAIYGKNPTIHKPPYRQIGITYNCPYPERGMLHCDEICESLNLRPQWYAKDECIYDFGYAVICGKRTEAEQLDLSCGKLVRAVRVKGADGKWYTVVANFEDDAVTVVIDGRSCEVSGLSCEIMY